VVTWSWNGRQLKTAIQLRSNFAPIGPCFGLPLPDLDQCTVHTRRSALPPSADGVTLLGASGAQTSHTAMASDAMRLETTAGPASWWPDRKLSTPLSAAAKAATAREPQCGAGTAAPTRAMLRCRPMPLRPECDDLHRASAPAGGVATTAPAQRIPRSICCSSMNSPAGSPDRNKLEQFAPNLNRLGRILERNWNGHR